MGKIKVLAAGFGLLLVLVCSGFYYSASRTPKVPRKSQVLEKRITALEIADSRWNVTNAPEKLSEINQIFSQHFSFIGKGKQCTAFVSHDGRYVLKFLLQNPLKTRAHFVNLPNFFPFTLFKKYDFTKRETRKERLFTALMISYHEVPEQTGTLYVHLNTTKGLFKKPLIVDTSSNPVLIDTDATQFVLQKRARHIKPVIIDLMCEGKVTQAKNRVDQVFKLLFETAKKGIFDADDGLVRNNNIGFLDNRAIFIDVGKLRRAKEKLKQKDFVKDLRRLKPFYRWLQAYYPVLAEHFVLKQKQMIESF